MSDIRHELERQIEKYRQTRGSTPAGINEQVLTRAAEEIDGLRAARQEAADALAEPCEDCDHGIAGGKPCESCGGCGRVLIADMLAATQKHVKELKAAIAARPEAQAHKGWCIRHADEKRWRTMDTIGMPDWTDDPAKALVCRLKEHVEAYAADDEDDVRIVEVRW